MLCAVKQGLMGEGFQLYGKPRQLMAVNPVRPFRKPLVGLAKLCTVHL